MAEPNWNTPARLNGLPCANWKKRTGVTMDGTVADCITRWLSLQGYQQRDVSMGWGPEEGRHGTWSCNALAAFVMKHGLPPRMAAERGGQPTKEQLAALVSMPRYEPCPSAGHPAQGAHGGISQGGSGG
jgi:hypothetical protein